MHRLTLMPRCSLSWLLLGLGPIWPNPPSFRSVVVFGLQRPYTMFMATASGLGVLWSSFWLVFLQRWWLQLVAGPPWLFFFIGDGWTRSSHVVPHALILRTLLNSLLVFLRSFVLDMVSPLLSSRLFQTFSYSVSVSFVYYLCFCLNVYPFSILQLVVGFDLACPFAFALPALLRALGSSWPVWSSASALLARFLARRSVSEPSRRYRVAAQHFNQGRRCRCHVFPPIMPEQRAESPDPRNSQK
jgi:hypothetical protein